MGQPRILSKSQIVFSLSSISSIRFVTVCIFLLGSTMVQAQQQVTRPRLLIGKDDPFTGLTILRSRYAAGMRPSDDIAGWALTYLITGDDSFAHRAIEEMRRTHPPEKTGSRTYMDYIRWSLAFDWLYNYKDFDRALKDRIAGELLNAAERMFQDNSLADPSLVSYHNYVARFLTLATFALTAIEGHPSTEARAAPLRERARRSLDNVLDISQFITPEGGYHESMDYMRITFLPMALLAELRRQHLFSGVGDLVMRDGWGPDSTWIEFTAGPYLAKHQHLDQNQFTIFHHGYLAIDSAADYTDTESPNYLNYYRRTIAHNTMLIYKPGEPFFWAENL